MPTRSRFEGLKLDLQDRTRLKQMETGGARMSVRTWRRVRTLVLLDLGYTVTAAAEALGTYRRETARVGKRYLAGGLEHALADDPRPKPVDGALGSDGGGHTRNRTATGTGDCPGCTRGPWPQAVAGNKCGACRRSATSSSIAWRTFFSCTLVSWTRESRSSASTSGLSPPAKTRDRLCRWCRANSLTPTTSTCAAGRQTFSAWSSLSPDSA